MFCGKCCFGDVAGRASAQVIAPDAHDTRRAASTIMTTTTKTPPGMDVIWKIASPQDLEAWKAAGAIVGQGIVYFYLRITIFPLAGDVYGVGVPAPHYLDPLLLRLLLLLIVIVHNIHQIEWLLSSM